MPHYRAEVVFTFEMATVAHGGRRLRELSSAAETVGFSLEQARAEEAPPPVADRGGWTPYAPLEPETGATGSPITVRLDDRLLGDLGNQHVDARLLQAILLHDQPVAMWLRAQGIDADTVEAAFPGTRS